MSANSQRSFRRLPRGERVAMAIAAIAALWMAIVLTLGGIDASVAGIRIRANDWFDPAIVAIVSALALVVLRRRSGGGPSRSIPTLLADGLRRWRTADGLLLTAILAVAAVTRFWALAFGLPHPAVRPDEDAIDALSSGYYAGHFNPQNFTYPPLFMLAVAAVLWLGFQKGPALLGRMNIHVVPSHPSPPAERIVARVLSASAGVVSVWLIFRIGARLFGRTTALVAAAFLALAFLHVRDSHFGVTDIPMTCMVLVAFLAIVRLFETGSRRDLAVAAISTGLAVATKYNAFVLALPATFAILVDPGQRPLRDRLFRILAFGAIAAATFLVVCPYAVLTPQTFFKDLMAISEHLANGQGPDLGKGWTYHLTTTLRYGLGAPMLVFGVIGLPLMMWREGRRGVLAALFPLAYYLVIGNGRTVFARYALPAVPFLCLAAAYAVSSLGAAIAKYVERPAWRVPAIAAMWAIVVWPSAMSVVRFDRLLARDDTRVIARRWIEARFAPGTAIAQVGVPNSHLYMDYEDRYARADVTARPAVVVIASTPLGSPNVAELVRSLGHDYELQFELAVVGVDDRENTYDGEDEFFLPLGGFHQIERPGPNLRIYVRSR